MRGKQLAGASALALALAVGAGGHASADTADMYVWQTHTIAKADDEGAVVCPAGSKVIHASVQDYGGLDPSNVTEEFSSTGYSDGSVWLARVTRWEEGAPRTTIALKAHCQAPRHEDPAGVTEVVTLSGAGTQATVACPAGKKATSGSITETWRASGGTGLASRASADGTGWTVVAESMDQRHVNATVRVECA